jgi:glycosyltransferase involved in cell wall biosynthesis
VPELSVLLAVHNDERYVAAAIRSVLRQTVGDLELVVVDDASTDGTPDELARVSDRRMTVIRNEQQLGLAASLNRALDHAAGRYVARLDADDVALPERFELQIEHLRARSLAIVGSAVLDLDDRGRPGRLHRMPSGPNAVHWQTLFSSPFFHPTVLIARERLGELRYDPAYLESEDYDLWTRLLATTEGANLARPLVLKRVHAGQASLRRTDLQTSFAREVALREIARVAPRLEDPGLAWELGTGRNPRDARLGAGSFRELLAEFERLHGRDEEVRIAASRRLARAGALTDAMKIAPLLPSRIALERAGRLKESRVARRAAAQLLSEVGESTRVTVVSPEPTPYRAPLFDRIAERSDIELTVIYAAHTVARRTWSVELKHRSTFLHGVSVPLAQRVFHHEYPITPGVIRALAETRPDVVVVSGWSTFASQAAIAWCRAHRIPYVLLVESHDVGRRARWRRAVKSAIVPPLVRNAAALLVVGTLARESMVARGASPDRVRVFANTIDVREWGERVSRLAKRRNEIREKLNAGTEDVVVLSAGRLAREKGMETLLRAVAEARDSELLLAIAGHGPERGTLQRLAAELGVRLELLGELASDELLEAYVAADVFALLSERESWGVVVNEAAATGLPLVLSSQVGAAQDLLQGNGALVPPGDVGAAAAALRRLAADEDLRARQGERSRELMREWTYGPSVENFVAAVREAKTSR